MRTSYLMYALRDKGALRSTNTKTRWKVVIYFRRVVCFLIWEYEQLKRFVIILQK